MPLYPQSVVSQGACPNFLLIRCSHPRLTFESIQELGGASPIPIHQTEQTTKEIVEQIPTKFIDDMNKVLWIPIIEPELLKVVKTMVTGESHGLDGVVIEFYMWGFDMW
jgi:hypothetical protein